MGAWDFNGNESGDRIIESDEKKKNVFKSKNYTKEKKLCNRQRAVDSTQQDGGKAFDKIEKRVSG